MINKKDICLVLGCVCLGILLWRVLAGSGFAGDGSVTVKANGKILGTYPLKQNQVIEINGGDNILEIKDGEARMIYANCRDKICVKHHPISREHESIVCLPNGVIVEVNGSEEWEFDEVSQ